MTSEPQDAPTGERSDILIGISSCLLGESVRFDKGHKQHSYIKQTLGQFFEFRSFCPEMAIGLGTPRETLRLVDRDGETHCIGNKTPGHEVTDELKNIAEEQREWHRDLCGYILKKGSPSCGMERVKIYSEKTGMPLDSGSGLYAEVLMKNFPLLPIEEEGRLGDPVLRENFIKRVFAYRHWRDLVEAGVSMQALTDFHSQYKYVLLSHHQDRCRKLGNWLANAASLPIEDATQQYFEEWMSILTLPATRRNHVNVLQHLQGFIKQEIDKEDKAELVDCIEQYRRGKLPLIVPITLLRHHLRRHPKPFTQRSRYLTPHPGELMLLNSI